MITAGCDMTVNDVLSHSTIYARTGVQTNKKFRYANRYYGKATIFIG